MIGFALITMGLICLWVYRTGKLNGFSEGISYTKSIPIHRNTDGCEHFCNVTTSNVVCFQRDGELWVKEYSGCNNEPEGRTYMVFYCPWCGLQTKKSKDHENAKLERRYQEAVKKAKCDSLNSWY